MPQIGCHCPTCRSSDPRDRRRRAGAYVRTGSAAFLLDTPPEMRLACVECGIESVDAIVLTHAHMDHVAGFDDVRRFNTLKGGVPLPCYAAQATLESMRKIFPYITDKPNAQGLFRPMIEYRPASSTFAVGDMRVTPVPVVHGPPTNGYLVECGEGAGLRRLAYIPDCHEIPEEGVEAIRGADVLVLDCLRERFHPTHLNRESALEYVRRIAPGRTFFIHMCHDVKHAEFERALPSGVSLSYDGLEIEV